MRSREAMESSERHLVDLGSFDDTRHEKGASLLRRVAWYWVNGFVFDSWLFPSYGLKRLLLRVFGAAIGKGVVIKPRVNIKYPWKLSVGEHSWIGEGVWIDNIGAVHVGAHCCISQGVYLCTGNHDWSDPAFSLIVGPIQVLPQAWVGAFSVVCPGVCIGEGSVIAAGSVVTKDTAGWTVFAGNPAVPVRLREVSKSPRDVKVQTPRMSGGKFSE